MPDLTSLASAARSSVQALHYLGIAEGDTKLLEEVFQQQQLSAATAARWEAGEACQGFVSRVFDGEVKLKYTAVIETPTLLVGSDSVLVEISRDAAVEWRSSWGDTEFVISTDLRQVTIWRSDASPSGASGTILSKLEPQGFAQEAHLSGSIYRSLSPVHRAALTRTLAFTLSAGTDGPLFGGSTGSFGSNLGYPPDERLERLALHRLQLAFLGLAPSQTDCSLAPLPVLAERVQAAGGTPTDIVAFETRGDYVLRRYWPRRSGAFNFGTPESNRPPRRSDFVFSYTTSETSPEFHRDFSISPNAIAEEDLSSYEASLDLVHALAIRRSGLFRLGFGERVYSVSLPPGSMQFGEIGIAAEIFPVVTLYRAPNHDTFRRTLTVTLVLLPVEVGPDGKPIEAVSTELSILRKLQRDLKAPIADQAASPAAGSITLTGPLSRSLGPEAPANLPALVEACASRVAEAVLGHAPDHSRHAASLALTAGMESRISSGFFQTQWHKPSSASHPWEAWMAGQDDHSLRDAVFRLLFFDDYVDPTYGYTSRNVAQLRSMNVGNTLGADMSGMTFFDPTNDQKVVVFPIEREEYPDYSIIRWMAFNIFVDSALASMQGMIHRFFWDLDGHEDLKGVIGALDEMVKSFAELYDLDIRLYYYRAEFEKIRELLRLDHDYELLQAKFESVKDSAELTEDRLVNKLVFGFTVSTVVLGIMAIAASAGMWSVSTTFQVIAPASIALVVLSYVLFDPVRSLAQRWRIKDR